MPGKPDEHEMTSGETSAPAQKHEKAAGASRQSSAAWLLHAHLYLGYSDVSELPKKKSTSLNEFVDDKFKTIDDWAIY